KLLQESVEALPQNAFISETYIPYESEGKVNAPIVESEEMRKKVWKEVEGSVFNRASPLLAPLVCWHRFSKHFEMKICIP
ncbi:hypothetical protein V3C99_015132, partial [Haemonchus contortus]